jgi:hypothetical protein
MEFFPGCVLTKNQFMKKKILVALAVLAGSVAFAQQKVKQPPPPPPTVVDVKEVPPPPPPPVVKKVNDADSYSAFLKRNPGVKGLGWTDENTLRIRLKSGKEEVYDLGKEDEALKLKDKYGELPPLPPPPPVPLAPPPPKVQKKGTLS